MQDLNALKREYQQTITDLHCRRRQIQSDIARLRGEEYFQAKRRITCLYAEEQDTLWALREILRSLEGRGPAPGSGAARAPGRAPAFPAGTF